jgi:hypothetical protein
MNPKLHILHMAFIYSTANGFHTVDAELERIEFRTCTSDGTCDATSLPTVTLTRDLARCASHFLHQLEDTMAELDPDVVVTHGGDGLHFPALMRLARGSGVSLSLSRDGRPLAARTSARTLHSYGQTLHKDGYIPLYGRLHIDRVGSFIVREGGSARLVRTCASLATIASRYLSTFSPVR